MLFIKTLLNLNRLIQISKNFIIIESDIYETWYTKLIHRTTYQNRIILSYCIQTASISGRNRETSEKMLRLRARRKSANLCDTLYTPVVGEKFNEVQFLTKTKEEERYTQGGTQPTAVGRIEALFNWKKVVLAEAGAPICSIIPRARLLEDERGRKEGE